MALTKVSLRWLAYARVGQVEDRAAGLQGLALEAGENAAFETRRPATLPIDEFRLRVEAFQAIAADLGQVASFAGQIPWMLVFEVWVGIEHFTHLLCVVGPV